jgi:hypothetical protein
MVHLVHFNLFVSLQAIIAVSLYMCVCVCARVCACVCEWVSVCVYALKPFEWKVDFSRTSYENYSFKIYSAFEFGNYVFHDAVMKFCTFRGGKTWH